MHNSIKLRALLESNFKIVSVSDCIRKHPYEDRVCNWASVKTEDGQLIEWEGVWFTDEEREEIDRDHILGDIM